MKVKQFGSSTEEDIIQDNIKAREIVQSVLQYGVNQKQIKQIIYLFAMEIEEHDLLRSITGIITKSRTETKSTIMTGE